MNEYELIQGKVLWPTKEVKEGCSIGFLMDHKSLNREDSEKFDKKWFNFSMEDTPENNEKMEEIRKSLKGAEVKFQFDGVGLKDFEIVNLAPKTAEGEKSEEKSGDWADDMTKFEDLLADAHTKGLVNIFTVPVEVNPDKKYALFKAVVMMQEKDGPKREFQAHGDATDDNIKGSMIKPHFIRMAETRAIARALRWATNNAKCAEEETSDGKLPESQEAPKKK